MGEFKNNVLWPGWRRQRLESLFHATEGLSPLSKDAGQIPRHMVMILVTAVWSEMRFYEWPLTNSPVSTSRRRRNRAG